MSHLYSKPEVSYVRDGLLTSPVERLDGRQSEDFRSIEFERGNLLNSSGSCLVRTKGCEWQTSIKLEIAEGAEVSCIDTQVDFTSSTLNTSRIPENMSAGMLSNLLRNTITLPIEQFRIIDADEKSKWFRLSISSTLATIDDSSYSNIIDTLYLSVFISLLDVRLPHTQPLNYEENQTDSLKIGKQQSKKGIDFELIDSHKGGFSLEGLNDIPLSITINVIKGVHFIDATSLEDSIDDLISVTLMFNQQGQIKGTQLNGKGELEYSQLNGVIQTQVVSHVIMPTKTLFSVWSLFDICLLVAGSVTISVSVSWASPDLLRDLVLNESERKGMCIYIIIVVAYSVFAILRRRAIYLKIFNLLLITLTLFAIIVDFLVGGIITYYYYTDNHTSTIYGFVVILICLFLATVCIINERAKEDRFRRIDAKRNVNKFAD
ncbi:hypothetical protein E3Q19_03786 [Wallemia mellicola]|nr:hypothetical protein E3Q19_03786 [Wallemia mellicola]TIC21985.1 hypothetical protein E3Q11_04279 [Wallemia mellicola]TIC72696.1 hypothetical protein E3Q00_03704 [Wallemia mellicola]